MSHDLGVGRMVVVASGCLLGLGSSAMAAVLQVPAQYGTIQAALDAAMPGDQVFVAPGTYYETIDAQNKLVRVLAPGGSTVTVIDGQGDGTVVRGLGNGAQLHGFTVRGGDAFDGAGLRVDGTAPLVTECTFEAGTATFGGAVANRNGATPYFVACAFLDNEANFGGAMYNREGSHAFIVDCAFVGNTALTGTGGAMYALQSSYELYATEFRDNAAPARTGGAVVVFDGTFDATECDFVTNLALDDGGAVALSGSTSYLNACRFLGNDAEFGGAIWASDSTLELMSALVVANTAATGAGVFSFNSDVDIVNATMLDNVATDLGGAVRHVNASLLVANSIVRGNAPDQISAFQAVTTLISNNIEGSGGDGNIDSPPAFVNPEAGDYRLLPNSPCLEMGEVMSIVPDRLDLDNDGDTEEPTPYDLDGEARVVGGTVDLGAFESQDLVECPADFNGDGIVDFNDLMRLIRNWGPCESACAYDLDGSQFVDGFDLYYFVLSWGPCGS